ncbi:anthranilate synthase component I [Desulfuribacillus stibiiarsenatis]|uniref:Anthranilate synthase component 1 n=1 Tax=Desulfuribacillus stibiiarsenatis TaxID=1390249 RepID=A0A1E5L718_9FIRM|nr:anthranilate synthase component I [Desulfuribacillus stibiiarsenatis]OEH85921.1 anthranilate synthase component I [Desulfuribacillus stibiiarsenatis]
MYPSFQTFCEFAKDYQMIPIQKEYIADFETPISIFNKIVHEKNVFLLESVEGGEKWARYSFIGKNPFLIATIHNQQLILKGTINQEIKTLQPLDELERILSDYKSPMIHGMPPFTGGAVGFFAYDIIQYFEKIPKKSGVHNTPEACFLLCDEIIVYDHKLQKMIIIANINIDRTTELSKEKLKELYMLAEQRIDHLYSQLKSNTPQKSVTEKVLKDKIPAFRYRVQSDTSKDEFFAMVDQAKEYIKSGDIFQVVLSQKWSIDTLATPFETYRILRTLNPSPYMYYLDIEGIQVVGTSPELLVRVADKKIETKPIAGTRPRGRTESEDLELEQNLLNDKKECSEHLMLVDLGRNDAGRVSEYGSVKVTQFMEIERYSHVMHIVSNVQGQLRDGLTPFDALKGCFPAGTVSGAPKVRAMEIIAELEKQSRGLYAGAIGYIGFSGNFDSCITIRTIIFENGKAYLQAGAGIVYDSIPEMEYQETINKAKALMSAIEHAEEVFHIEEKGDLYA